MFQKKKFLIIFIVLSCFVLKAQYTIPESYLEKAVLIEFPNMNASGSGFFLSDSNYIYLVTARHVVFHERFMNSNGQIIENRLIDTSGVVKFYSKDADSSEANIMAVDFFGLLNSGNICYSINADIMVTRLGSIERKDSSKSAAIKYNSFVKRDKSSFVSKFDITDILKFDHAKISDDIFMIGYPKSLGLQENIQYDFNRPLLRKGTLSGKYRRNKTLIVDCPSFFGNSGGPIIEIQDDHVYLLGIVTQLIPFTDRGKTFIITQNSGFSIIEPIDKIYELINQVDVTSKYLFINKN